MKFSGSSLCNWKVRQVFHRLSKGHLNWSTKYCYSFTILYSSFDLGRHLVSDLFLGVGRMIVLDVAAVLCIALAPSSLVLLLVLAIVVLALGLVLGRGPWL